MVDTGINENIFKKWSQGRNRKLDIFKIVYGPVIR